MSDQSPMDVRKKGQAIAVLGAVLGIGLFAWSCIDRDPSSSTTDTSGRKGAQSPALASSPGETEARWQTEEFNLAARRQLQLLAEDLEADGRFDPAVVDKVAAATFRGDRLRPQTLPTVYNTGDLVIRRHRSESIEGTDGSPDDRHGVAGLLGSLGELMSDWEGWSDIQLHFKITSVDLDGDRATTLVLMESGARQGDSFVQQRARWRCVWELRAKAPPRLVELRRRLLEEVTGTVAGGRLFIDATAGVLRPATEVAGQLSRSIDHWRGRLQAELGVSLHGHQGLAIGDVNGDGLDDLYLCQPGGLPNRLLIQQTDGTVRDRAREAGVDWLDRSRGALLLDFDNDGDQDLACVLNVNLVLMSNEGGGRFIERETVFSTGDSYSLAAADYDGDGDLDLYITGYGKGFLAGGAPVGTPEAIPYPYHDANNGGSNRLLRNDGDWRFRDVTDAVGLGVNNRRWSFAAGWADYDMDGDPDLYVANDYGRNCLYRNDGGRFTDVAATAGVEDIAAGMSVSWCDFNGDGRPDLYVGNMFSSAGERIAFQRRFQAGASEEIRGQFQRHARGNTLFENVGDGSFRDVSVVRDVTMGRWAWGSPFLDINNDGRPDLLVANGYVTGSDTNDL
jgi:hypothetical protein